MRWINAEKVIHTQIYDDGHEEWSEQEMTIEEFLDAFTDEGCPTVVTQPEQQWIPCSERLPEKDQICIVTDDTQRCAYEYGFHNDTYDEVNGWTYLGHKIIAWMPLPEPWKGEIDGENNNQI